MTASRPAPARRCLIYARFSSDKQNPLSCSDQVAACRSYAAAQGWEVVDVFEDAAISGTRGRRDRRGWDRLLELIEGGGAGPGAVVLTWDIDRWSRDWSDGMIEALRIHKLGVDLADTKDGILAQDGLAGKLMLTLKVAGADEYVRKLSRNVRRGLAAKRAAGYWTGPPPFGFNNLRTDGGAVLVGRPDEASVVRRIFAELDAGRRPTALARELNRGGVRTRLGGAWSTQGILVIATNPVYIGKMAIYQQAPRRRNNLALAARGRREVVDGRHAPLVDAAVWRRVADTWAGGHQPKRCRPRVHPLSGLVLCGACGRAMTITGGGRRRQGYRCPHGARGECASERIIRVDVLEGAVLAWLQGAVDGPGVLDTLAREISLREREETARTAETRLPLEADLADLRRRAGRYLEALEAGGAPKLINQRLAQLEGDIEALEARLEAVGGRVAPFPQEVVRAELEATLAAGAADLQRVRGLVDSITVPARWFAPAVLSAFGVAADLLLPREPEERSRRYIEARRHLRRR